MAGPGQVDVLPHFPEPADTTIRVFNFDTGVDRVKSEHEDRLAPHVRELILAPITRPFVHVTGMSSRAVNASFTEQANRDLSRRRAERVRVLLMRLGVPPSRVGTFDFVGADDSNPELPRNSEFERAVLIVITQRQAPPIRLPRPPVRVLEEPRVLRSQGMKIQLRLSLRAGIVDPLYLRFMTFRIWDLSHMLACDYVFAGAEFRRSLPRGGPTFGASVEGPFNPIVGFVSLGAHEFTGPAKIVGARGGLPSFFGGPRASRSVLIMTPAAALFAPFWVNPLRTGGSIGRATVLAANFVNADMMALPGPFPFLGPTGPAASGSSLDD